MNVSTAAIATTYDTVMTVKTASTVTSSAIANHVKTVSDVSTSATNATAFSTNNSQKKNTKPNLKNTT